MPKKRKTWIMYAFIIELFATLSFTFFVYLESDQSTIFFAVSIVLRGLQGVGAAIIMTCTYSFVTNELGREKDKYIGYAETTMGIGDLFGPGLGGLLYAYFGYAGTFIAFSVFIYIGILCSVMLIPKSLNKRTLLIEERYFILTDGY